MEMEAVPALAVVDARFYAGDAVALEVAKTLSLSGNDFTITDAATGTVVLQVDGVLFSLLRRCLLIDADHRSVFTVQESIGVRSMTFNPDGRSLLCGLHESLKVFSWEPVRCHDTVDVGWSRLSDLNVREGNFLVVHLIKLYVLKKINFEPYAMGNSTKLNGHSELKSSSSSIVPLPNDSGSRANIGRLPVPQNSENNIKATTGRLSGCQNSDSAPKETKSTTRIGLVPGTPQRAGNDSSTKTVGNSTFASNGATLKRSSLKSTNTSGLQNFNKVDVVPVIIPRTSSGPELSTDSRNDAADVGTVLSKGGRILETPTDSRKESSDVATVVVPRTNSRMEISSDSVPVVPMTNSRMEIPSDSKPFVPKSGRRLESSAESRKESSDATSGTSLKISSWMEMGPDSVPIPSKASRRCCVAHVVVPRTNSRMDMASDSRREISAGIMSPFRLGNAKVDTDKVDAGSKNNETDDFTCQIYLPQRDGVVQTIISEETWEEVKPGMVDKLGFPCSAQPNTHRSENYMYYVSRMCKPKDNCYMEVSRAGRARSIVSNWESRDQSRSNEEPTTSNSSLMAPTGRLYSSAFRCFIGTAGEAYQDIWGGNTFNSITWSIFCCIFRSCSTGRMGAYAASSSASADVLPIGPSMFTIKP
ncbi:hypothetical protein ABZP36_022363 [Zizania latifolia]